MKKIARIRSGGQSGVEQAALDSAQEAELQTCGWCSDKEMLTEYGLKETKTKEVEWNVRDSHATLIISPEKSKRTKLAELMVGKYHRPYHIVGEMKDIDSTAHWLNCLGDSITLNVTGPDIDECEVSYLLTRNFLEKLIEKVNGGD